MRFARSMIIAAAAATVLVGAGTAHSEIEWSEASWDAVRAQAKAENRFVFVDFYTTWCGPCKRLDKITYADDKVIAFLNSTVPVKYDGEKGMGEKLAKEYRVHAWPTLIVFNPQGEEIDRYVGYLPPDEFLSTIEGYTRGEGTTLAWQKQLAENPDDIDILFTLGMKYADAVRPEDAQETFARIMELDPEDAHGKRSEMLVALGGVCYDAEQYQQAKEYYEQVIEEYPEGEVYEYALTRLARAEYKLGNADAAVAAYDRYVALHPDDPKALNGLAWFCGTRGIGLDRALAAALKAVDLSDRDPGIFDTLAEVYFARGEYDKAIVTAKEALESDPDDQYFRDQVEKFEKAKAEADSQASR